MAMEIIQKLVEEWQQKDKNRKTKITKNAAYLDHLDQNRKHSYTMLFIPSEKRINVNICKNANSVYINDLLEKLKQQQYEIKLISI